MGQGMREVRTRWHGPQEEKRFPDVPYNSPKQTYAEEKKTKLVLY